MVLDRLRKRLFGTVVEDPVFGRIRFRGPSAPRFEYWKGTLVFAPTGAEISIVVHSDKEGPGEEHRVLMQQLVANWAGLKDAMAEATAKEFFRYFGYDSDLYTVEVSTPEQILERLKLSALRIVSVTEAEIELEFFVKRGTMPEEMTTEHPLMVTLRDWMVVDASF